MWSWKMRWKLQLRSSRVRTVSLSTRRDVHVHRWSLPITGSVIGVHRRMNGPPSRTALSPPYHVRNSSFFHVFHSGCSSTGNLFLGLLSASKVFFFQTKAFERSVSGSFGGSPYELSPDRPLLMPLGIKLGQLSPVVNTANLCRLRTQRDLCCWYLAFQHEAYHPTIITDILKDYLQFWYFYDRKGKEEEVLLCSQVHLCLAS